MILNWIKAFVLHQDHSLVEKDYTHCSLFTRIAASAAPDLITLKVFLLKE